MLDNLTERQNLELASIIGFKQPHMKCVTCNHLIASSQPRIIRDDKYYHQNTKDCESNGVPGKRLKALRQKHKLSADILAHMLGKAKSYIYGLEKKVIDPNEYKKIKTLIQQRSKSGFARVNGRIPVTKEVRGPRPTYTPKQKEAIKQAGADLKAKRVAAGLTRANVAKFLKISPDRLEAWERGLGKAPDDMLEKALDHIKRESEHQNHLKVNLVPKTIPTDPEVEALQNMAIDSLTRGIADAEAGRVGGIDLEPKLVDLEVDLSATNFLTFAPEVDLNTEGDLTRVGLFTMYQDKGGSFRLESSEGLLLEKDIEIKRLRAELEALKAQVDRVEDARTQTLTAIQGFLTGASINAGG